MTDRFLAGQAAGQNKQAVYDFLDSHSIAFQRCDHRAVYTCEEADKLVPDLPGARTKNLFLRDRKGRRHFLLIVRPDQRVDLRALSAKLAVGNLSLASPERLKEHLGVDPGSVSFLALLHDRRHAVEVIFEQSVWTANHLLSHPMVNTSTLVLSLESVRQILNATGHKNRVIKVPER
jgi:Ala-tRNA(Pro) deacylase